VVYDEFASNEEMFAKLKAGGSGYDITFRQPIMSQ
jgi:spermidine/putrescine transport system substrate-binding protein